MPAGNKDGISFRYVVRREGLLGAGGGVARQKPIEQKHLPACFVSSIFFPFVLWGYIEVYIIPGLTKIR